MGLSGIICVTNNFTHTKLYNRVEVNCGLVLDQILVLSDRYQQLLPSTAAGVGGKGRGATGSSVVEEEGTHTVSAQVLITAVKREWNT